MQGACSKDVIKQQDRDSMHSQQELATLVNKRMFAESEAPKCLRPCFSTLADLSDAHLQSMVYKKIYRSLCASPAYESLIADAVSASSTGKHNAVVTHTGSLAMLWQTKSSNTS